MQKSSIPREIPPIQLFSPYKGPSFIHLTSERNNRRNKTTDALFEAILSLETREECYNFFEDLCTVKEISDMAQRLEAAKLLLGGSTYDQIVKAVEISTATISRINRCIQYGSGGYRDTIEKVEARAAGENPQ